MRKVHILLVTVATSALVLTACQNSSRRQELAYVERPVEMLYARATDELDDRDFDTAILLFNEVERQHPYSEWARRSSLMSAFASYESRKYDEAVSTAQRYLSLNPAGQGAPYAYYLIAVSHFDQIMDVGRDQKTTELARDALTDVVRRYPDTDYAKDAAVKLDMVSDQLAGKEMEIGRWYLRRNQHLSAVNRFRTVVSDYDTTSHAPEALHRLVEVYLAMGLKQEALAAGSVLGYNYPESVWYRYSYRLLSGQGLDPEGATEVQKRTWLQRLIPGGN
ncbi:MAG: outer membrane protein assembly factor BamD [Pseudomonadota bacterium]|jgi:outer membrane protein assembly factor BamD|nr:outer membrane protein assembly factor BamD [Pseudomonadota bacterium]